MVIKGHFSWYTILNVWKRLLFAGDCFADARSIDSAMPPLHMNLFTNGVLILKIYFACSFADAMFSSGNFIKTLSASCLSCARRAFPRANLHISILSTCTMRPKVSSVSSSTNSFGYSQEKSRGCVGVFTKVKIWNFESICISRTPYWFSWFSRTNTVEP